jgi:hypothetical protein
VQGEREGEEKEKRREDSSVSFGKCESERPWIV